MTENYISSLQPKLVFSQHSTTTQEKGRELNLEFWKRFFHQISTLVYIRTIVGWSRAHFFLSHSVPFVHRHWSSSLFFSFSTRKSCLKNTWYRYFSLQAMRYRPYSHLIMDLSVNSRAYTAHWHWRNARPPTGNVNNIYIHSMVALTQYMYYNGYIFFFQVK